MLPPAVESSLDRGDVLGSCSSRLVATPRRQDQSQPTDWTPATGLDVMKKNDWQRTWSEISRQNARFVVDNWKVVLGAAALILGALIALAIERWT